MSEIVALRQDVSKLLNDSGRIEGKLDTFISQMKAQDDRATELEVRTRKVEARQHWYSGAGAMIGLILGSLFGHGFHGST
jgi:hypothetical protein